MTPRDPQRPNVIDVNCPGAERGEGLCKHGVTTMLPGMLIDIDSTSANRPQSLPVVKLHGTEGADCVFRIAKNDLMRGQGLDDAFTPTPTDEEIEDDTESEFNFVPWVVPKPDEGVMVRVADEFSAANGTLLKSAGDGTFIAHGGTGKALCQVDDEDGPDYTVDPAPADRVLLVRVKAL